MHTSEFANRVEETPRSTPCYIRTFHAAGLALNNITRLLKIRDAQRQARDDDPRFLAEKYSEIDERLHTVTEFRTQLANFWHPNLTPRNSP